MWTLRHRSHRVLLRREEGRGPMRETRPSREMHARRYIVRSIRRLRGWRADAGSPLQWFRRGGTDFDQPLPLPPGLSTTPDVRPACRGRATLPRQDALRWGIRATGWDGRRGLPTEVYRGGRRVVPRGGVQR